MSIITNKRSFPCLKTVNNSAGNMIAYYSADNVFYERIERIICTIGKNVAMNKCI